jgi:hypothetical protein
MDIAHLSAAGTGDLLELPLATSGLSVGVGFPKKGPRKIEGTTLSLPLATTGLTVGVGGSKPVEPRKTEGDTLSLPLATVGVSGIEPG